MNIEMRKRKNLRIPKYDYSNIGYYFITICIKNRENILSKIISNENDHIIKIELLPFGKIAEKFIKSTNTVYNNLQINDYIIMPNHVHFICEIYKNTQKGVTPVNATIPSLVGTLKKIINKECKEKIWQRNYYEHIIRNEKEYLKILDYIQNNPYNWLEDKYYL